MKTQDATTGGAAGSSKYQSSFNKSKPFSKRSNAMSYKNLFRYLRSGGAAFLILILAVAVASAQGNLNLTTNVTGSGTILVTGNVTNTAAVTVSPRVVLTKNSGTQNLGTTSAVNTITFNYLSMQRTGSKTQQVPVIVNNGLHFGDQGGGVDSAFGGTFDLNGRKLTVGDVSGYQSGTLTLNGASSEVEYNKAAATQTVLNTAGGLAYGTLTLTGAATKTFGNGGGSATAATFTQASGAVAVADNLSVSTTMTLASLGDVTGGKSLTFTGAGTPSITAMTNTAAGTLTNNGSGALTIATLSGNAGVIQNTSSGSIAFTNAATSTSGSITASSGSVDFNSDLTGGALTAAASTNMYFGGAVAATSYSFNASSTATYDQGTAGQVIAGTTYGNLTAAGANKTGSNDFTAAGTLALSTFNIAMANTKILTLTSTTGNNVTGTTGEVTGIVQRAHSFTASTTYAFNRPDVYMSFVSTAAGDIKLNMSPGTNPTGLTATRYAQRQYKIEGTPTYPGNLESIKLIYSTTPAELQGGAVATSMGIQKTSGTWSKLFASGYTRTPVSGSVTLSKAGGIGSLAGVTELAVVQSALYSTGSTAFNTASTWDENVTPTTNDDVLIQNTHAVTSAVNASVANVDIASGGSLDVSANTITASGAITNAGTLALTGGNLTISGTLTNTNALSSTSGTLNVAGVFTNNSTTATSFAGEVNIDSLRNVGASSSIAFNGANTDISRGGSNDGSVTFDGATTTMGTLWKTQFVGGNLIVGTTGNLTFGVTGGVKNTDVNVANLTVNSGGNLRVYGDIDYSAGLTVNGTVVVGDN